MLLQRADGSLPDVDAATRLRGLIVLDSRRPRRIDREQIECGRIAEFRRTLDIDGSAAALVCGIVEYDAERTVAGRGDVSDRVVADEDSSTAFTRMVVGDECRITGGVQLGREYLVGSW